MTTRSAASGPWSRARRAARAASSARARPARRSAGSAAAGGARRARRRAGRAGPRAPRAVAAQVLGRVGEMPQQARLGALGAVHERRRGRHAQVGAVGARQAPRAAIDDHAALEDEPAAHLLVGQVGRVGEVLHHAPEQLVRVEAQQRAQRAVHADQAALGRDQRHGHRGHVEGAVEAGERGLAARVDAAAGDERVQAHLQLVGAERLDHAVVGPRQQQPGDVVGRGREGEQRHLAQPPAQRGDRARAGGGVEHDGVGAPLGDQARGLQRVGRVHDVVAAVDELADVGAELGVAGDDEDAPAIGARLAAARPARRGARRRRARRAGARPSRAGARRRRSSAGPAPRAVGAAVDVERQVDHEQRAALGRVGERDHAVVQRDEIAHDRQPEAGAAGARGAARAAAVALEDGLAQPVVDAGAAVGDLDAQPLAGVPATVQRTVPPNGAYFSALASRLETTESTFSSSTRAGSSGAPRARGAARAARRRWRSPRSSSARDAATSTSRGSSSRWPPSRRETCSSSSTRLSRT